MAFFSAWFFFRLLRHVSNNVSVRSKAKRINEDSATVYRLVEGSIEAGAQLAVSEIGFVITTDPIFSGPTYAPVPVPFQLANTTWLPWLPVSGEVTVNFAVEPKLYHPLPPVDPYSEVTVR